MDSRSTALWVACVVILILIIVYVIPEIEHFESGNMVVSTLDNEPYLVRTDYKNAQEAANILAEINQMFVKVITHLKRNRMNGPWARQIAFLAGNYSPIVLGEHVPSNLKYTSYVAFKGKKIRMCLRTAEDRNVFHDRNTLRFVALHELSHLAVESYGHIQEFWNMFAFILKEAASIGEITLIDYSRSKQLYCGIVIENSPFFT